MSVYFISTAAISPTLLPMFLRRKNAGDVAGAWGQVHTWLLAGVLLLAALCTLAFPFSDQIAATLAPGFDQPRHELCTRLLKIMIPTSLAAGLLPILCAVLDAHRKFAIAPLADILSKVTLITAVVLWATSTGADSAAWGSLAGYAASLLLCEAFLWRHWRIPGSNPDIKDPDFRLVSILMLAPAAGNAASRIGNFVENAICSTLDPGSITYLALAQKLINMPLLIIPIAAGTVLFTVFVELKQRNDDDALAAMLGTAVRTMLFLFLPLAALTLLLPEPVVSIVYQRGAFDASSVPPVANLFRLLAPMLCLLSIEVIIMR
jgi:putative peptidoglycan lipid II flippase